MIARTENGTNCGQGWDAQNRLISVTYGITSTNSVYTFGYDPDGTRAPQVAPGNVRTACAGSYEHTITATLNALDTNTADWGSGPWTAASGLWGASSGLYQQSNYAAPEATTLRNTPSSAQDLHASVRVRLDGDNTGTTAMAGIIVRRSGSAPADSEYLVALRRTSSLSVWGIYENIPGTWNNRTPSLAACKVPVSGWHVLGVRVSNDTRTNVARRS